MNLDDLIQQVGIEATIVRDAGNVDTYVYIDPRIKNTSFNTMPFERQAMLATTAGIVEGDLLLAGGDYYLVISAIKDQRAGEYWADKARLFRCNHTVSIKAYNETTKQFAVTKSNVPCLIVSQSDRMRIATDRGVVLPTYKGQDADYGLFIQASSGVDKNSRMVDENNYPLSVCANINPYFVKGLLDVPVRIDRP